MTDRLLQISVDRLTLGPNVRERVDAGLRRSIEEHGVLQPITVAKRGERYQVLYGHRRVAAAKAAGLTKIPAIVVDQPADLALRQVIENVDRKPMSQVEIGRALRSHLDANPGMIMTALAKAIGRSIPYVSNKLELLELGADVMERVETGQLGAMAAIQARRLFVHYRAGRPRHIPEPVDGSRSASVTIPIANKGGSPDEPSAVIGIDLETRTADLVVSNGRGSSVFLTLSPDEAKLLGRRLVQASEAILASSDRRPPPLQAEWLRPAACRPRSVTHELGPLTDRADRMARTSCGV